MPASPLIPRPEHPRPDFMRPTYLSLNGEWQFAFDDADEGLSKRWFTDSTALSGRITVPFCYQSAASGIGTEDIHPLLWYRRSFSVPADMRGGRVLLRFGAVDYRCDVYVNGLHVGAHTGGYTPFALDITHALKDVENDLCLRVEDAPDRAQPRGKQYWETGLMGCWYTPTSGIWQSVYLEGVGGYALTQIHITPDIDQHVATVALALDRAPKTPLTAELTLSQNGSELQRLTVSVTDRQCRIPLDMLRSGPFRQVDTWTPESPTLYDLQVRILDGERQADCVSTYFGMRKVEVKEGYMLLNNMPYYQRLILDQGYWPDTLLTPPSDEAIQKDILLTKQLGFNGARKHQKIEDPRYYYWADKLGLLVWGEVPSAYDFCDEAIRNLTQTTLDFIDRDFNHPSIITWVPLNESWGVTRIYKDKRMQQAAEMLYHQAKALDGTRLVSVNDGWEQVKTDIFGLHDYAASGEVIAKHFADQRETYLHTNDWRMSRADSFEPTFKEAFLLTEYGGIAFSDGKDADTWGYHDKVKDEDAFFARYKDTNDAVRAIPYCQGYCYTQLTDVQQETNGLLTPDRKPKVDVDRFRALTTNPDGREGR